MNYTTQERNKAILLIASGKADFKNAALYEKLETFNWLIIKRLNGIINTVELSYSGKDLCRRLLKQQNK